MPAGWFIVGENGRRWNHLSGSWAIWIWGTDYPTREEAEAEAVYLTARSPNLIGKIRVEETPKWPTQSES